MKSSREAFEAWVDSNFPFKKDRFNLFGGEYKSQFTEQLWQSWQASRAAIVIELPSREDPANFFCEVYDCDMVHESLANCGLKVKS